jgi:glycolate oxidase FAD binding subunit
MSNVLQQFHDIVIHARERKLPLRLRGGGSKDWYGQSLKGTVLDTRGYSGIVDYEPTELVITARCGTPLAEIEAALAERNQMLAFEPPHFGPAATFGGMVASGLSGPRRQFAGALRDFMLGAVLMDGRGEVLHFGGRVMKNVAGYDVSRLLSGSLGTLGLILEASLKVMPTPLAETTLQLEMKQADAIRRLNEWGAQPLPISATAWHDGLLLVRLSGAQAAVRAAREKVGGDIEAQADAIWQSLREHSNPFFTDSFSDKKALWRLSLPSITLSIPLPGEQLIEWGGAQRWLKSVADAAAVRSTVAKLGGHATLYRGGIKAAGVFHPLQPAVAKIHRRLKEEFDPANIFNRGRMYETY